jgi:hypothetical protein
MFFSIYSNAQEHSVYKCRDIVQRDSITNDLKNKGYVKYDCGLSGLFLDLQADNTFCLKTSLMGYREVSKEQLYSLIKENKSIDIPKNNNDDLCSEVAIETDKFTQETKYNSPTVDNISFIKYKKNGVINQYVSINVYNTYLSGYSNYGLTILFESGKKIIRSKEKVDVNTSTGSNWSYSVFFTPTANEINLLKKEEIEAVKLYIFEANIKRSDLIKKYANCVLITPKPQIKKK